MLWVAVPPVGGSWRGACSTCTCNVMVGSLIDVDVCGRPVAGVVGPVWAWWWWWLWLDCLVVVVSAGGPDDGSWVCGGGWACMVVVMVCHCGWCTVWYRGVCGLR